VGGIRESRIVPVSSPFDVGFGGRISTKEEAAMPRRHRVFASLLAGVALVAAGCTIPTTKDGGGYGPSGEGNRAGAAAAPVQLRSGAKQKLSSRSSSWIPTAYVASSGAKVVLDVVNDDTTQHNFTLTDVRLSKNIPADGRAQVRFTAPEPGRYRFYCKYHREEMQGWLTVR
jgi:plastocyanin